ncbi:MAG: sporulation integral membrane protein YtvI [Peptococcaceae bacterium]|nr:sporulation integral membrane protein YtvI [Peptococcaceae bacterium]
MPKPILIFIYAVVAILVLIAAYVYVIPILVPFIVALIITALMEPLTRVLQRLRVPRSFAVLLTMLVVFGSLSVLFIFLIVKLISELLMLAASLPAVTAELKYYYQLFIEKTTAFYITLPPSVASSLEQSISSLASSLQGLITSLINSMMGFLSIVPGTIAILIFSLLATYFLARDRQMLTSLFIRYMPATWGEKVITILKDIGVAFVGYFRAQVILALITTILSVVGLYLIGSYYALTIGLLVGLFDMIPVLGPATIYIPWVIWSFATGDTALAIKLLLLYGVVFVVRQVMEAKVVSANLGLHPLETMLAMYAGLKTIGLAGLILGPIILIALKSIIKAVGTLYNQK